MSSSRHLPRAALYSAAPCLYCAGFVKLAHGAWLRRRPPAVALLLRYPMPQDRKQMLTITKITVSNQSAVGDDIIGG